MKKPDTATAAAAVASSSIPTYRQIAKLAGVSVAAVSFALKNRPGVSPETREHVLKMAEQIGYKPNPLVTALMTRHRRQTSRRKMRSIIACIMSEDEVRGLHHSSYRTPLEGVKATCDRAGFICQQFTWEQFEASPQRLFAALRVRNVPGVVFHGGEIPERCREGWDRYAMVSINNRLLSIRCDFASTDHYNNVWIAMKNLVALGYRRIGFAMTRTPWVLRSDYRALSAYQGWSTQTGGEQIPPFWAEKWSKPNFLRWMNEHRPDALVIAEHEPLNFLREAGWRIPDDVAVAHLDLDDSWTDLAGVHQNGFQAGEAAANLLIDTINNNTYGIPLHPRSIQIAGDWVPGPTVRAVAG